MSDLPEPPYPADTRAKGWRFELDLERVKQSDTWALASPELRPWLLMLWTVAWEQTPCGSMPSSDALIAARLGMKEPPFKKAKSVLMRGWWLASDQRLYHETITERVLDMLGRKEGERKRKADYRARMDAERKAADSAGVPYPSQGVPPMSHGTDVGQTQDSHGSDATGTGTGTGTGLFKTKGSNTVRSEPAVSGAGVVPMSAGLLSRVMREFGIQSNPADPRLVACAEQGISAETVRAACEDAKRSKPNERVSPAYVLAIIERWSAEAAKLKVTGAKTPKGATGQKFDPVAYVNQNRVGGSRECSDDIIDV